MTGELKGSYSVTLIILSVVIACWSSYDALTLNQRVQQTSFLPTTVWRVLSAIVMGLGIWSMHFIGMNALLLPVQMLHSPAIMAISTIPAIFSSYLAFYVANHPKQSLKQTILASLLMGLGISSMHYIDMMGIQVHAERHTNLWTVFLSTFIAIATSFVALSCFSTVRSHYIANGWWKVIASVVLGIAISSMHYVAMAGVTFTASNHVHHPMRFHYPMDRILVSIATAVSMIFILTVSLLASLLDRYINHRLHYVDPITLLLNQRQFEIDIHQVAVESAMALIQIQQSNEWISGKNYRMTEQMMYQVAKSLKTELPNYVKIYQVEQNRIVVLATGEGVAVNLKEEIKQFLTNNLNHIDKESDHIETICSFCSRNEKTELTELFANCMAAIEHPLSRFSTGIIEYNPAIHENPSDLNLEESIYDGIANRNLFLDYQPKVSSKTEEVTGVEALLRWQHPVHGLLSPAIFIPIMEKSNKIFDVTDYVIETACQQIEEWVKKEIPFQQISVNIPGTYVPLTRLSEVIQRNIKNYPNARRFLELEITETSAIANIDSAVRAVRTFRNLGLSVALDDFGTGLSSLSYLRKIPISTIKIDKSFIDEVPRSQKDAAILRAMIDLCFSLNLEVVIEGVETKEQYTFLQNVTGSPQIQGYYFSKPLSTDEFEKWLAKRKKEGAK